MHSAKSHHTCSLFSILLLLLAACESSDSQVSADDRPESTSNITLPKPIVETPNGRWSVTTEVADFSPTATELELAAMESSDHRFSEDQLQLLIETQLDMRRFLSSEASAFPWEASEYRALQAVPGVPNDPRYSDPKFQRIRDAFSADCVRDAQRYTSSVFSAYSSQTPANAVQDNSVVLFSNGYESSCLRELQNVPVEIRRVIGVLRMSGAILCSATITGERELLTARHCFFDADNGTALASWQALAAGTVSFYPIEPHNGRIVFPARKLDNPSNVAFEAYDDAIRLRVLGGPFTHWASKRTARIEPSVLPMPAWLVGSNALLGDVQNAREPFEFVRGAAPDACALMEVTNAGCLYHTCQAGASTSGAGILVVSNGAVVLQGVHKGSVARAIKCETAPPLSLDMNLAVSYPQI